MSKKDHVNYTDTRFSADNYLEEEYTRESLHAGQVKKPSTHHQSTDHASSFIGGHNPLTSRLQEKQKAEEDPLSLSISSPERRSTAKSEEDTRELREGSFLSDKESSKSKKSDLNRDAHQRDNSDGSRFIKRPSLETKTSTKATEKSSICKATGPKITIKTLVDSTEQAGPTGAVPVPKRRINDFQRRTNTLEKHRPGLYDNIRGMVRSPRSYTERAQRPDVIQKKSRAVKTEIHLYPDLYTRPGRLDCRTSCSIKDDEGSDNMNEVYPPEIILIRGSRAQTDSLRNIFDMERSENSRRFSSSMVSQNSGRYEELRSPYRRTYDAEHHRYRNPHQTVHAVGRSQRYYIPQNIQTQGKFS